VACPLAVGLQAVERRFDGRWPFSALCRLASGGGFRRAPTPHRSGRGAIRRCAAGHSQWHRGSHHPARPRGPIDLLDTPTRSPLACGRSWPSAAPGPGPPPTFCVLAPNAGLTGYRVTGPAGPKTPVHSLAASAVRRLSSGSWVSISRSVAGAATAAGSLGCVHARKYRQHRQHRPRFRTRAMNKTPPRWISDVCEDNCRPSGQPIVPSGRFPTRADDADGADANSTLMKSRRCPAPLRAGASE
jgi:hypothetical protein